jgi:UDP-N-acetylmuramoylalanine--D-glutamate ligase
MTTMAQASVMRVPEGPLQTAGRRVVVVGAGASGAAAARLLRAHGATVVLSEEKADVPEAAALRAAGVAIELGANRAETLAAADLIVVSPGVSLRQPAVAAAIAAGVPLIGEIELASRYLSGRIVAVTGTKGKSTTTTLIGRMLEAGGLPVTVGGNLGTPLSSQVAATGPDVVHVVETSSFQLETIAAFHPHVSVFLNFSPDHLDRHASIEEYASAKARIFENQTAEDVAVVNAGDPAVMAMAAGGAARQMRVSATTPVTPGVSIDGGMIVARDAQGTATPLVPVSAVRLLGPHLVEDVVAAAAVAHVLGVASAAITGAVAGFTGLEHALEPVAEVAGVRYVNDSKATNVEAARRAIESFGPGLVVIMGGRYKGGDFRDLRAPLSVRHGRVIAIGETAGRIAEALAGAVPVEAAPSIDAAVERAAAHAAPGGTVLLAPACSSFDMFDSYADRGHRFKRAVARLAGIGTGESSGTDSGGT